MNFTLGTFYISNQAKKVMEIVMSCLSKKNRDMVSIDLAFLTARSCMDLFRLYQENPLNLEQSSLRSMILYNDCIYIIHHLTTIGQNFDGAKSCFIDMVPLFKDKAISVLTEQVGHQKTKLSQIIYQNGPEDKLIPNILQHLTNLSKSWKVH